MPAIRVRPEQSDCFESVAPGHLRYKQPFP